MAREFVYLAAVIDWFSRRVLSWRLSITMEADFCLKALEEALARHGRPQTFNTDQGSQFTSHAFTSVLLEAGIAIGMDGGSAWRDDVFVERLWQSIKHEKIYLRAYDTDGARRDRPGISPSTTGAGPIRALTGAPQTKPTSTGCRIPQRPEPGRISTYPSPGRCSDKPSHLSVQSGEREQGVVPKGFLER